MYLAWLIYAITVLDGLRHLAFVLGSACGLCIIGLGIAFPASEGEITQHWPKYWTRVKQGIASCVLFFTLAVILPSSSTSYMMAGAYVTQTIAQSDTAKQVGGDLLAVIEKQLKELSADDKKK